MYHQICDKVLVLAFFEEFDFVKNTILKVFNEGLFIAASFSKFCERVKISITAKQDLQPFKQSIFHAFVYTKINRVSCTVVCFSQIILEGFFSILVSCTTL